VIPRRGAPAASAPSAHAPGAPAPTPPAVPGQLGERDIAGLVFVGEMYGIQLDQLATLLGVPEQRAGGFALRWRRLRYAESARLGPGRPWVWLTRTGLGVCGLPYTATAPALSRLAHIRAVTAVRLAIQATASYAEADAYWRGERRLRARAGGRVGLREHFPDGEIHWPDSASPDSASPDGASPDGASVAWAGECWAVEAELTRKTVARTAAIMTEILTRTGDYGCPAAEARVPGREPRHARVLYLCSPAARHTVARARDALGGYAARVEIRDLPPGAAT
jgi:hypothetical protein